MSSKLAGPLMLLKFPAHQYSKGARTSVDAYGPRTPGHPRLVGQYRPDLLCILPALCGIRSESSCTERLLHLKQHDTWAFCESMRGRCMTRPFKAENLRSGSLCGI
jgi:hypothetical protein